MKILVVNCGSSSLKYQLFDMTDESVLAKGLVERIGIEGARIKHTKTGMDAVIRNTEISNHKVAFKVVVEALLDDSHGALKSLDELSAVGHRVVHAGEKYAGSVMITQDVIDALEECVPLAPLHNPANLMGIYAVTEALPNIPQVGVFDTAFHQTMPGYAYMYGVPYHYYEKYKVRRYGFHGTSHFYVSRRAAEILGKPVESLNIVTCHMGNGSSIAAVKGGKSVDTSMGFSPLPGVIMGTRSGDVDPLLVSFLSDQEGIDNKAMSHVLNKESGLLGISGVSSDLRDIEEAADAGNQRARLAEDMLYYGVRKYIGSYAAAMGGMDVLVFTAGIGENSGRAREGICTGLEFMGVKLDLEKNNVRGKERIISTDDSRVKVLVVPTDEELVIARDTKKIAMDRN
ncbi:acetate kinase [Aminivibrio pyruvatiphilus]|jgi:acetate kinase|uniref:Acetate kinase n=1 Tax=Aminivibrio pyruvatiphilus TaxID=1005740 RepID=A0A4R8MD79_9BACT|nr:acetate kinase [Aminivibrio pyruvatiphilus]TDY61795.1 acetate kinase [Aminivibrio pyruvatiphilus]